MSMKLPQIYEETFIPDSIAQFQVQNFFNFFISTMFWLAFIPFYQRLYPIFVDSGQNATTNKFAFHDVPNFNTQVDYEVVATSCFDTYFSAFSR